MRARFRRAAIACWSVLVMNQVAHASTTTDSVERVTVETNLSYRDLIGAFEHELGRWNKPVGDRLVATRAPWSEVQAEVAKMSGPHGLMVLLQADQGDVASLAGRALHCRLYLVGNPVIATGIINKDIRAGMLVPFRVQIYEEGGRGVLSYDLPSSFLGSLKNPALDDVGIDLDRKIAAVVQALQQKR